MLFFENDAEIQIKYQLICFVYLRAWKERNDWIAAIVHYSLEVLSILLLKQLFKYEIRTFVERDDAVQLMTYHLSDHVCLLSLICTLFLEIQTWSARLQYMHMTGRLPQVFQTLPEFVIVVFMATRPFPPRPNVIKLDRNGIPVNDPSL